MVMDKQQDYVKTGTSTLGICYKGGAVVRADHRATMGHFIANKSVKKLFQAMYCLSKVAPVSAES